jgi:hypothetical protein
MHFRDIISPVLLATLAHGYANPGTWYGCFLSFYQPQNTHLLTGCSHSVRELVMSMTRHSFSALRINATFDFPLGTRSRMLALHPSMALGLLSDLCCPVGLPSILLGTLTCG